MTLTPINPSGTTSTQPYVLRRDEGEHRHFLNHLATTKVAAGNSGALSAVEFRAERGFGPPLHCHEDEDEMIIVLQGEIAFRSGDAETVATTGATVFLPRGVPHTFQIMSDEARFTSITASVSGTPQFDRMVGALGMPVPDPVLPEPSDLDPGHVATVCAAHGIEVLGPPPPPID